MNIPNPEVAKILRSEVFAFDAVLRRAGRYVKTLEGLNKLLEDPKEYVEEMLPEAAKDLQLSFLKLVELYDLPYTQLSQIANDLRGSEYLEYVKETDQGLELDQEAISKHIEKTAVIELKGYREMIWKKAERLSKELNSLKGEINKTGSNIQLANIIKSDYAGNWSPNKAYILTINL